MNITDSVKNQVDPITREPVNAKDVYNSAVGSHHQDQETHELNNNDWFASCLVTGTCVIVLLLIGLLFLRGGVIALP